MDPADFHPAAMGGRGARVFRKGRPKRKITTNTDDERRFQFRKGRVGPVHKRGKERQKSRFAPKLGGDTCLRETRDALQQQNRADSERPGGPKAGQSPTRPNWTTRAGHRVRRVFRMIRHTRHTNSEGAGASRWPSGGLALGLSFCKQAVYSKRHPGAVSGTFRPATFLTTWPSMKRQ